MKQKGEGEEEQEQEQKEQKGHMRLIKDKEFWSKIASALIKFFFSLFLKLHLIKCTEWDR